MAFTFFFRDLPVLHAIRDDVIPELRKNRFINVWDAGCAMGPEPYSIAIIFKETLGFYEFKRLQITPPTLMRKAINSGIFSERAFTRKRR